MLLSTEVKMLEALAENVRSAAFCLERWSGSANHKARVIGSSCNVTRQCACVYGMRIDLVVRDAETVPAHIKTDIKNALSFLDSDPEVKLVVEAHKIVEDAFALVEGWYRCYLGREICMKHRVERGSCFYELWQCHDFESFHSAPEEGALRGAAEGV
jgi:hypothetical protein